MAKKLFWVSFAVLAVIFILLFVTYPPIKLITSDPALRKAWQACHSAPSETRMACYEKLAVEQDNPDICWLTGPSIDDACMETVFKSSKDPDICSRITKPGVKTLCEEYFQKLSTVTK
jgi:hypothetical protein